MGVPAASTILDLQTEIREMAAEVRDLERALTEEPGSRALLLLLQTAEKRLRLLEEDFGSETDKLGVDICAYRMFSDTDRYRATDVFNAVNAFQAAVSQTYGALKAGTTRQTGRVGAPVTAATAFEFGYAFHGSLGFVLTIQSERLLIGESYLDQSIDTVFKVARAQDPTQIAEYAKTLGPAPIRAMYNWAHCHAVAKLGADIEWRRGSEVRGKLFMQMPELRELYAIIEMAGEEKRDTITVDGTLVTVNTTAQRFTFETDKEERLHGSFREAISLASPTRVPKRYQATIEKTSRVRYSMADEDVSYRLIRLVPLETEPPAPAALGTIWP